MLAFSAPTSQARAADAGSTSGTDSLLVTLSGSIPSIRTNRGNDGRLIAYPSDWTYSWGSDGRAVAFPWGGSWRTTQGPDGRLIAYPSDWTYSWGSDGRAVAFPWGKWTTATGSDGRMIIYPRDALSGTFTLKFPDLVTPRLLQTLASSSDSSQFNGMAINLYSSLDDQ
ncbi:hypothetical protein ACFXOM_07220 [Streptomyces sp. NPDC059169]